MVSDKEETNTGKVSIFDTYSKSQKTGILIACAGIALLTPFTDTVYLPALKNVGSTLHASDSDVNLSVSAYLAAAAVGQLFWGSFSDYYGRTIVLWVGLVLFEAVTIGCIFSDTIQTLIALRTIEGFFIGSSIVSVSAIIADVFPPAERGTAMGAFLTPLLVGPVVAPVVGGVLSQAYNWRATFVLLAIMTIPFALWAGYVLPETHHYFVVQRVAAENEKHSGRNATATDDDKKKVPLKAPATSVSTVGSFQIVPTFEATSEGVDLEAPPTTDVSVHSSKEVHLEEAEGMIRERMVMPWESLMFLLDPQLAPSYCMICATFAVMFTTLTTLPLYLSIPPYSLSTTLVGILFLPGGIAMLIAALVGGILSDMSAARYPKAPEGRLIYSIPFMLMVPVGAVAFGFSLAYGTSLGYVLVSQSILCFGQAAQMPTVMGYLTAARPKNAAAVGSVMMFVCFAGAAVSIAVSAIITAAVGLEYFYVILAGLSTLAVGWATYDCTNKAL